MRTSKMIKGLLLGAAAVAVAGSSADAQSTSRRHGGGKPPVIVREVPPPLLSPNSLGLLERDFQLLRRTSPNPNQFMGGRWNPSYEVIRPQVPTQGYGGGGYYYPPSYGYGYGYPYPPNYNYGPGYYGYPNQNSVVQREVIIYQNGVPAQAAPAQPVQPAAARPVTPASEPNPGAGKAGDDFYLRPGGDAETLTGALDDIRKAWLNGDFDRFNGRLRAGGKLKVYPKGHFKYAVDSKDFSAMIKDAMGRIDTMAFEFDRPKSEEAGKAFVSGKHTFLDAEKQKQTTYISYGLEKVGAQWKIVEAGSSSSPISAHAE